MLARNMWSGAPSPFTATVFPLQVAYRADPLRPKQLEAANMHACQQDKRVPRLQLQEKRHAEMQREVNLAGGKSRLLVEKVLFLDVLHLSEPLRLQECFGHVLGSHTNGTDIPDQPNPRRLGWRLRGHGVGVHTKEPRRPCECQPPYSLSRMTLHFFCCPSGSWELDSSDSSMSSCPYRSSA